MDVEKIWSYDIWLEQRSRFPRLVFPAWSKPESLAVLSPHDDDALLGAGYAILAARALEVPVSVLIVCNGCAGYSSAEQKSRIVGIRRAETLEAYAHLGLGPGDIYRFDVPDFSAVARIGW